MKELRLFSFIRSMIMTKSIILINKNSYIYNGEEYDFDKFDEINNSLKSNIKIVILEEELYVKQFNVNMKRRKIYEFIDYKINNDFPQNGDILYDFEKNNNTIAIYSIKGAKRIEKIAKNAKKLEVKPIQFIIKDTMGKILRNNPLTCKVLIKYNEYYYYTSFKEGLYDYGFATENKDIVLNTLLKTQNFGEIYVDDDTANLISLNNKFKIIKITIGELINERIYKKQKFYTRKVL
jgi:hypothetical protein